MNAPKLSSFLCAARNRGAPLTAASRPPKDNRFSSYEGKGGMQTGPAARTGLY